MSASKDPGDNEQQPTNAENLTRRSTQKADDTTTVKATEVRRTWPKRRRLVQDGGSRFSRPLTAALIIIIAGGAYLFWPRGGGLPQGIGEQFTIITSDTMTPGRPRSGSVDIHAELQPLVAERPVKPRNSTTETVLPTATESLPTHPASRPPVPAQQEPVLPKPQIPAPQEPAQPAKKPTTVVPSLIQPQPAGGWAVQVGAFGSEANAETTANQLKTLGIDAQVRAASTSSGNLVFRVWIGWFQSRDQAQAYAVQERSRIGEAHPVHR